MASAGHACFMVDLEWSWRRRWLRMVIRTMRHRCMGRPSALGSTGAADGTVIVTAVGDSIMTVADGVVIAGKD